MKSATIDDLMKEASWDMFRALHKIASECVQDKCLWENADRLERCVTIARQALCSVAGATLTADEMDAYRPFESEEDSD